MASNFAIRHAAHQVRHGGIIVYPTETIYGLGCDPMNVEAVNTLCKLKNRDIGKGLILLANRLELFADYIESLDADAQNKINQRAKPTSWVVPAKKNTPSWLTGNRDMLVIRITQHPVVAKLCDQLRHPLVSSSANPGGYRPALNTLKIHHYFHHKVDAILVSTEPCSGQPSSIKQLSTGRLLRS